MSRIKILFILFVTAFPFAMMGQGETSNWYFGNNAGITFNNDGSVTPVTNGKLNTFEGCTTISDAFGGLLFYTDGITVYTKNHTIMENGNGLFGDPSSTQSAIIVPKPEDPNVFYIFTVDTSIREEDPDRGLNYTTVDMSLSDGQGAVTNKNIPLLTDCSEKVTAVVKDCSNQSIWVLTFASLGGTTGIFNTFHAFEINTTGVVLPSVKTTFEDIAIEDPRGYLKISPDGTKLVNANMSEGLHLYDFDATTGKLSNQQEVIVPENDKSPYGIEFSPNSQYLYTHVSNNILGNTGHRSSLLQYDLLATDIAGSEEILDTRSIYRGALQLGSNGKIYRTIAKSYTEGTPFLGVIENPNQKGVAAGYKHNAVSLNNRKGTQGLPPFIQSFFNKTALVKNSNGTKSSTLELCAGESFVLEGEDIPGATYQWEKDGTSFTNYFRNILEVPSAANSDSGTYRLTIIPAVSTDCPIIGEALIKVLPLPEESNLFLEQCDVDANINDGMTKIDLNQVDNNPDFIYTFYKSVLDRENDNPIPNPDTYTNTEAFDQVVFYKVENSLGCENFGELALRVNPTIVSVSNSNLYFGCDENPDNNILESTFDLELIRATNYPNLEVNFYETLEDVTLELNPLSGNYTSQSTSIYVRIENSNQCLDIEEIQFVVNPVPSLEMPGSYLLCTDGPPVTIEAPLGYDMYRWIKNTGNSEQEIGTDITVSISEIGNYILEVGYAYPANGETLICTDREDFVVNPSNRAGIQDIDIQDIMTNNTVEISVSGDGDYEYSLDGLNYQDNSFFENVAPGNLTVFVRDKNGCGITKQKIAVIGYPKFFTPNGDGTNDFWQIIGADNQFQAESIIFIFDRYGKLISQIRPESDGWNGYHNNRLLPPSDYWFKVLLQDGREFKGHFVLKQ